MTQSQPQSDTPESDRLREILQKYAVDPSLIEAASAEITSQLQAANVGGAVVDLDRARRCGFPEVVYGEGKSPELVLRILEKQQAAGQACLVTRVSDETALLILAAFPAARRNEVAQTVTVPPAADVARSASGAAAGSRPDVVVLSAGSCDAPVAQEAAETLAWMQIPHRVIEDVGVAGPHRLLRIVPALQDLAAVVVVAGMEAALPSVVGGHVNCPVIGVPTSVGYGVAQQGMTALFSMLTCCASNVLTVNIDAGFRGGYAAGLIARGRDQARSGAMSADCEAAASEGTSD